MASSGRSKAGSLCRLDANVLDMVKTLCRCVDFARFAFVLFHFSIRTNAYRMAICVSHIFTNFAVRSLFHLVCFIHFIILSTLLLIFVSLTSASPVPQKISAKFPLNTIYVMLPHRAHHYLSSQSAPQSNSLWISCLSIVCLCVCVHCFVHVPICYAHSLNEPNVKI